MKPSPQTIGEARENIIEWVLGQPCSIKFCVDFINREHRLGTLTGIVGASIEMAWQKPRDFILTERTFYRWLRDRLVRGHYEPLTRQKDARIKPWYEPSWLLREQNPKLKVSAIHRRLINLHPDVSYWQLRRPPLGGT